MGQLVREAIVCGLFAVGVGLLYALHQLDERRRVVCSLCVQWRCTVCKSNDWPECCDWTTDSEAYWPDGTVATITQDEWCETCRQSVIDYEAEHAGDVA